MDYGRQWESEAVRHLQCSLDHSYGPTGHLFVRSISRPIGLRRLGRLRIVDKEMNGDMEMLLTSRVVSAVTYFVL
jgi:hypothetical protein